MHCPVERREPETNYTNVIEKHRDDSACAARAIAVLTVKQTLSNIHLPWLMWLQVPRSCVPSLSIICIIQNSQLVNQRNSSQPKKFILPFT